MKRYSDYPFEGRLPTMLNDLASQFEEVEKLVKLNSALGLQNKAEIESLKEKQDFILENGGTAKILDYHDYGMITREGNIGDLYEEHNKS